MTPPTVASESTGPGSRHGPTTTGQVSPRTAWAAARGWFYDRMFLELTASWYRAALSRFPLGARVLDVGIGTGGAMIRCAELVRDRKLHVVGLDIDRAYFARCQREVAKAELTDQIEPVLGSIHDHEGGPYDAVYFSASLMILPDPVGALRRAATRLAPGGRIYCTQTFQHRRSPVLERAKPLAYLVTTIHFGRVTYESEFCRVVGEAGLELEEFSTLHRRKRSSYRLAVVRPASGVPSRRVDRSMDRPMDRPADRGQADRAAG